MDKSRIAVLYIHNCDLPIKINSWHCSLWMSEKHCPSAKEQQNQFDAKTD